MTAQPPDDGGARPVSEQHAGEGTSCTDCGPKGWWRTGSIDPDGSTTATCGRCGKMHSYPAKVSSPQPQHAGEHSPEPWTVARYTSHVGYSIWSAEDGCIAERWYPAELTDADNKRMTANAALIARAPALQAENRAQAERIADLELFVRFTRDNSEHAAPLHVLDEPGYGAGWIVYYHDERELFIPDDGTGLPALTDMSRSALRESGVGK